MNDSLDLRQATNTSNKFEASMNVALMEKVLKSGRADRDEYTSYDAYDQSVARVQAISPAYLAHGVSRKPDLLEKVSEGRVSDEISAIDGILDNAVGFGANSYEKRLAILEKAAQYVTRPADYSDWPPKQYGAIDFSEQNLGSMTKALNSSANFAGDLSYLRERETGTKHKIPFSDPEQVKTLVGAVASFQEKIDSNLLSGGGLFKSFIFFDDDATIATARTNPAVGQRIVDRLNNQLDNWPVDAGIGTAGAKRPFEGATIDQDQPRSRERHLGR